MADDTSHTRAPRDEIAAFVRDALESAGTSGLCREGCLEVAVSQLRVRYPEIDMEAAWTLVRAIDAGGR